MKKIKIYLRSVEQNGEKKLSLFDSNRQADFNDLTTEVPAGSKIIWKPDKKSGIKKFDKIYPKDAKRNIFKTDPVKRFLCKGMKLKLKKDVRGEEAYGIKLTLRDGTRLDIDPRIKIYPPPP